MRLKKGSNRIVFIFPTFGFVIKLPRFFVKRAFRMFVLDIKHGDWDLIKKSFGYSVEQLHGYKNYLLCGLHDNWHEYTFYKKNHHVFCQPTYFSLFGFINIQKYGKQQEIVFPYLLVYFDYISNNATSRDGHHFINWRNFCFEIDKVKILDYGSKRTQNIILQWGEKIASEFSLKELRKIEDENNKTVS